MPAMSRSTRSSVLANGSLQRTVRCAWSLSFRWTQSTVKSRRFSCARRTKSPRSLPGSSAGAPTWPRTPRGRSPPAPPGRCAAAGSTGLAGDGCRGRPGRSARPGGRELEAVLGPVPLDQPVLDHPVDLPVDQREVPGLHCSQRALPQVEDHLVRRATRSRGGPRSRGRVEVLGLDLRADSSRPLASFTVRVRSCRG